MKTCFLNSKVLETRPLWGHTSSTVTGDHSFLTIGALAWFSGKVFEVLGLSHIRSSCFFFFFFVGVSLGKTVQSPKPSISENQEKYE